MLENGTNKNSEDSDHEDDDLLRTIVRKAIHNVEVKDKNNKDASNELNKSNPVFDSTRASSKVSKIFFFFFKFLTNIIFYIIISVLKTYL